MSPILSELYSQGYMNARSYEQTEVFKAAETFARCEGILPAPESSHAIKGTMTDTIPADADLEKGFESIPQFPGNTL